MDLGLEGKRALVTGGSRGIGRAICQALAADGCDVAFCARGQESLDAALAELGQAKGRTFASAVDVREPNALSAWVATAADQLGGLDIVISNVSTRVDQASPEAWLETFQADLMQHVRLKQLALPHMEGRPEAAMVFVGSVASVLTTVPPYEEAYGAMKAGLVALVGQWAAALGPKGVRVNAVSPGPIDFEGGWWDMVRKANAAGYERASKMSALGRMGRPEEVARAAVFLASPAASYVTGANLRVDGALLKTANF